MLWVIVAFIAISVFGFAIDEIAYQLTGMRTLELFEFIGDQLTPVVVNVFLGIGFVFLGAFTVYVVVSLDMAGWKLNRSPPDRKSLRDYPERRKFRIVSKL